MQIYTVHTEYEDRWVLDPEKGAIKKREALMKPAPTTSISIPPKTFESCPDGETFDVQPDGSFHVPNDVGQFFCSQSDWHEGLSPFPPAELVEAEKKMRTKRATKED